MHWFVYYLSCIHYEGLNNNQINTFGQSYIFCIYKSKVTGIQVIITQMSQRWPLCIGPQVISLLQANKSQLKSSPVPKSNFYASNHSLKSPSKQILSHLEPACFAYPVKYHPIYAIFLKTEACGYKADPQSPYHTSECRHLNM